MKISYKQRPGRGLSKNTGQSAAWLLLAFVVFISMATACYDSNTGRTEVGGAISFTLPAFPETGGNAVEVFTEMHYQPSYRSQEGPRLQPPPDSVPITGRELRYTTLEEYTALAVPERFAQSYDPAGARELYETNCQVCHGPALKGDGPIVRFMKKGPLPADLTLEETLSSTDGELFGFITLGGRQGLSLRLRGLESVSPMPEFGRLLAEDERWALVQFLRNPR